jgi:hypothetical protein
MNMAGMSVAFSSTFYQWQFIAEPEFVCNTSWSAGRQQEMEAIIWPADAFVKRLAE